MEFKNGIVAYGYESCKCGPHVFNDANVGANEDTKSGKAHHSEYPESLEPLSDDYQKEKYNQDIIRTFILTVLQTEDFTQFTYHKMPRMAAETYES